MVTPKTELSIRCDGEALAPYLLEPGEYTIGSAPECEVRIERPGIADRHVLLTVNYDEIFVEPVDGTEVRVNDRPISGYTRLWPHQRVQVGSAILEPHRQKSAAGTADSLPPSALQLQRLLPPELHRDRRYDISGEIGQGGMGVVLDARDPALRRAVAMKVLLDQHAGDHLLRFIEEAQITGQLEHPSIPPVHELGVDENGKPYYTMKLVRGQTLREVLAGLNRGEAKTVAKYSLPVLITVFQKVCDAMAFAHEKKIIHRDLKPENIMLGRFGEVLVMDWGLAKVLDETVAADMARRSAVTSARVEEGEVGHTLAGSVVGTPQYMSPEQAAGEVETLDARSDIYALGAILYHILALRPPVEGGSVASILAKVTRGEIEPVDRALRRTMGKSDAPEAPNIGIARRSARSTIPASLAAVVRKAMALDPNRRYASVPELQRDIAAYQGGFATSAEHASAAKQVSLLIKRHKGMFATGLAAWLVITALAVWFVMNVTRERNRAESALTDLKQTAPTFAEYARSLIEQQSLDDALKAIRSARDLDPPNPDYAIQEGHILETLQRYPEAANTYRTALQLRPEDEVAKSNLALVEALEKERNAEREGNKTALAHLHSELVRQQRTAESVWVIRRLTGDAQRNYETWKPVVEKLGLRVVDSGYRANKDGTLTLHCDRNTRIADLRSLEGMPLSDLNLDGTSVRDLTPLRGMPLSRLIASNLHELSDLEPLRGMPLRSLSVTATDVTDLSPLKGMALVQFRAMPLGTRRIADIVALQGMPLEILDLGNVLRLDTSILEPMPLKELSLSFRSLSDLSFLQGKGLAKLKLAKCDVQDLSPLAGMPLRWLQCPRCEKIEDLSPLRGMPLEVLILSECPVSDLSPLDSAPLRVAILNDCQKIMDVKVLASIPTLEEITLPPNASPEPLRALPNLKRLSYRVFYDKQLAVPMDRPAQTAAEFWAEYDAGKK